MPRTEQRSERALPRAAGETRDMSAVYLQNGIQSMAVAAKDNENCALLDGHVDVEVFLKGIPWANSW